MLKKLKIIYIFLILLLSVMVSLAACAKASDNSPAEFPKVSIKAGSEQKIIDYEILPNKWEDAVYDRPHYTQVLLEKLEKGEVNKCQTGDEITFDFGKDSPQKLALKADQYTDRSSSYKPEVIEIPLEDNSFKLYSIYAGNNNNTFFVLTATWEENKEIEYAFVVNISDPETPTTESRLARFIFTDQGEVWEYYLIKEKDGKKGLFTEGGEEVLPFEFQEFMTHYDMISARKDDKWQFYDYSGQILSQDEWDDVIKTTTPMDNEVNGLVRVQKNGLWGCVDQEGKVVITPNWDEIHLNYYEEVEPFLRVKKDGKYGYLTYEGEMVLEPEWDMAVMDVYNSPQDEIFVRLNDEWGTVKVVNNKAGEVDWNQKPRLEIQIGFMDQRYIAQAQTVHDLLYSDRWGIKPSVIIFFYDYFKNNYTEISNLPDFNGGDLDWDQLTKFVYANSGDVRSSKESEARSYLTEEEFDRIANKYFEGIAYTHQPSKYLDYEDGKYTPTGWSDHGFHVYYLKELRRFEIREGQYKFRVKLIGYPFAEEDFREGSDSLSPNMQAIKKEAQKPQYQGKTLQEVLDQVMFRDPTKVLTPSVEHTIEFIMNNPLADIWLKYLSASKKEL